MFPSRGIEQPRTVGVASPQRHHLIGSDGAAPSGTGVEWSVNAAFYRQIPERQHILLSVIASEDPLVGNTCRNLPHCGRMHIFVINLRGDDRTAVFVKKTFDLTQKLLKSNTPDTEGGTPGIPLWKFS